jgi:hypothetical protein
MEVAEKRKKDIQHKLEIRRKEEEELLEKQQQGQEEREARWKGLQCEYFFLSIFECLINCCLLVSFHDFHIFFAFFSFSIPFLLSFFAAPFLSYYLPWCYYYFFFFFVANKFLMADIFM